MSEAKKRGRPAEYAEPMHPITTRLPESVADRIQQIAVHRGTSVHIVLREAAASFVARNRQAGVSGRS